jgi:acyl carrier protein
MDITEFIEKFAGQFMVTEPSEFTKDTVFHELDEYTSLIALMIISMIDEEYGVTVEYDDMAAAVTIEDLFNTVKRLKGE